MNFLTLSELTQEKKSAIKFLQKHAILHTTRFCTNNHEMKLSLGDANDRWRCRQRICQQDIPVRKGTWIEGTRITYRQIILFIYCWSKEMTSISFCNTELKIGVNTTIKLNKYLREICAKKIIANPIILGGPNRTVEIDESMFSRRKYEVGRVMPQQWVFGALCRETGECLLVPVPDRSKKTLMPIIEANILPGTTIII